MPDTPANDGATEGATPDDTTTPPNAEAADPAEIGDAAKKALAEERKARREAERKFKDQASELESLRLAAMTEQEQAVAKAAADARTETLREVGASRVDDAVRVALAGRSVDVDALLEGMDRGRFLDDEGQPDRDGIQAWVDRIAPAQEPAAPQPVDLGQGTRTPTPVGSQTPLGSDPLLQGVKAALGIH